MKPVSPIRVLDLAGVSYDDLERTLTQIFDQEYNAAVIQRLAIKHQDSAGTKLNLESKLTHKLFVALAEHRRFLTARG